MFIESKLEPADVILIPGGSHPQLTEKAAHLYHEGFASYLLPSGGSNPKLESTEWEYMQKIALSLGVPEQAILKEDRATNTFENARFSWEVLQQLGIMPGKAILVCKSYHARRALLTYQVEFPGEVEFMIAPVTDNTGITRENWFMDESKINKVMNEFVKIGNYFRHHIPNWASR